MNKTLENYAFIDSQNLNLSIKAQGWELDFRRFRIYLQEKYGVARAYLFVTGDGDFYCLVKYLNEQGKLLRLLVPNRYKYSTLLRSGMLPGLAVAFVNDARRAVEYKKQHP